MATPEGGDLMNNKIVKQAVVVGGIVGSGLLFASFCLADIIHLKNGRVMEGEVNKTDKGLWIEGVLFQEDEIERIEKTKPAQDKTKPWYSDFLSSLGVKGADETQPSAQGGASAPRPASPPVSEPPKPGQKGAAALPAPSAGPMGFPFLAPPAQQGYGQDFSAVLEQAQRVQDEANQRQMMMMQEVMKAEEGAAYYDETLPQDVSKDVQDYQSESYPRESYPKDKSYEDDNQKKGSGGRRFKSMKIDDFGNMSWE